MHFKCRMKDSDNFASIDASLCAQQPELLRPTIQEEWYKAFFPLRQNLSCTTWFEFVYRIIQYEPLRTPVELISVEKTCSVWMAAHIGHSKLTLTFMAGNEQACMPIIALLRGAYGNNVVHSIATSSSLAKFIPSSTLEMYKSMWMVMCLTGKYQVADREKDADTLITQMNGLVDSRGSG